MKAVQIGCGLVGSVIARDLAKEFDVTVVDMDAKALEELRAKAPGVRTLVASCVDEAALAPILADADIVTAGVPGRFGRRMMEIVIGAGKNLSDISFMPEDFEELDGAAREKGVTVLPDIGVAPGMSNFLIGRGAALLDEVEDAVIYVGGIPEKKIPPFNYQATWSPADVIEEYTRPARYVKDGQPAVMEAMGDLDLKEFPKVGALETFITDGLRSLIKNVKAKNMQERTMRWPGHVEQMRLLRSMGLFDEEKRLMGGVEVVPRDVACGLLFPMWKMDPEQGDRDLTIMQIKVRGFKGRDEVTHTWDLFDRFSEAEWTNSMGRCTGCTCAIFARALMKGLVRTKGVVAAERIAGDDDLYRFVMEEQRKRGLRYEESVSIRKDAR
jgi:saccharopine dehydrogenase-like NADP-dependent oxidoreductase